MQLDRQNLKLVKWLKEELNGCNSVLDLGCGQSSLLQYVSGVPRRVGVEYWGPYIKESRNIGIHTEYINSDILTVDFPEHSFDAVMLVDVLEHIEKHNAYTLIENMVRWSSSKVIICVPNGDMPQEDDPYGEGNEKQRHVSQWTPEELTLLGFEVRGFGGWKPLRGEGANIIPTRTKAGHYALSLLSLLSEPVVRARPTLAFHLFAIYKQKPEACKV